MTAQFGIREITRNFSILDNYDYVAIEDKKVSVSFEGSRFY